MQLSILTTLVEKKSQKKKHESLKLQKFLVVRYMTCMFLCCT